MEYNRMVEGALKGVVRQALERAASEALPGEHHFYLTFRTDDPGTEISDVLAAQYPEEMTIVLQHKFWGLEVTEAGFHVTLTFNKMPEALGVPFDALTGFYDPSVQFGLQFQSGEASDEEAPADTETANLAAAPPARSEDPEPPTPEADEDAEDGANIVTLDQFRKK